MAVAERPPVNFVETDRLMSSAYETDRLSFSTNWSTVSAGADSSRQDVVEHHADGLWTVTNPETGIFGSGLDEDAAFADFEMALLGHLDILSKSLDSLSEGLRSQLDYLLTRLRVS